LIVEGGSPVPALQTLSNGSVLTFYDESNQSIAQEFRGEESTVGYVIPSSVIMPKSSGPILEINTDEAECFFADLQELESSALEYNSREVRTI
jgi:hypothetical protein